MGELAWDECPFCGTTVRRRLNPDTSAARYAIDAQGYPGGDAEALAWICHACCGLFHRYDRTDARRARADRVLSEPVPSQPGTAASDRKMYLTPPLVVGKPWVGLTVVPVGDADEALEVMAAGKKAALPAGAWIAAARVLRALGLCDHLVAERLHFARTGRALYGDCPHCPDGGDRRRAAEAAARAAVVSPSQCASYRAGHHMHWIHARHVRTERNRAPSRSSAVPARVTGARDGLLTVLVDGQRHVLIHHDPQRVAFLPNHHPKVLWLRDLHVLYFDNYLVHVAERNEFTPCTDQAGQRIEPIPAQAQGHRAEEA
jgi:hypothetical protein